jgi:predicted DNA-binding transcriptional regulator AlpA
MVVKSSPPAENGGKVTWVEFAPPPETLLNTAQVCQMLGITKPTLYKWMQLGLPSHKPLHRRVFVPSEVMAWVKGRCIDTAPGNGEAVQ